MIVTLTEAEAAIDDADAIRHVDRASTHGWNGVGYHPGRDRRLAYNATGYRGERAAHIALFPGRPFVRDMNGFHKTDVGPYAVRTGSQRGYGLIARLGPHNPPRKKHGDPPGSHYLLVVCLEPLTYLIVGSITYDHVLQLREQGIGRKLPGTDEPWLIPQEYLTPFRR